MARMVYLEFHDDAANSHKFYRVTFQSSDDAFIEWGRVGSAAQSQHKSHAEGENKINEKLAKGYRLVRDTNASSEVFPKKKRAFKKTDHATSEVNIWDELAAQTEYRRAK